MKARIVLEIEEIDPDDFEVLIRMVGLGYMVELEQYDPNIVSYELISEE